MADELRTYHLIKPASLEQTLSWVIVISLLELPQQITTNWVA